MVIDIRSLSLSNVRQNFAPHIGQFGYCLLFHIGRTSELVRTRNYLKQFNEEQNAKRDFHCKR